MALLRGELERVLSAHSIALDAEGRPQKRISSLPRRDYLTPSRAIVMGDAILGWRHDMLGDYDQNGEVNISDLTPAVIEMHRRAHRAGCAAFHGTAQSAIALLEPRIQNLQLSTGERWNLSQACESPAVLASLKARRAAQPAGAEMLDDVAQQHQRPPLMRRPLKPPAAAHPSRAWLTSGCTISPLKTMARCASRSAALNLMQDARLGWVMQRL